MFVLSFYFGHIYDEFRKRNFFLGNRVNILILILNQRATIFSLYRSKYTRFLTNLINEISLKISFPLIPVIPWRIQTTEVPLHQGDKVNGNCKMSFRRSTKMMPCRNLPWDLRKTGGKRRIFPWIGSASSSTWHLSFSRQKLVGRIVVGSGAV